MICIMFVCFFIINEMNFQKENMFTENFHHYNIEIDSIQKNIIEIHNDINELEQIKKEN